MVVEKELESGQLMEVPSTIDLAPIYTDIAWHKDKQMHPCLEDFIAIAKHSYEAFRMKKSLNDSDSVTNYSAEGTRKIGPFITFSTTINLGHL